MVYKQIHITQTITSIRSYANHVYEEKSNGIHFVRRENNKGPTVT